MSVSDVERKVALCFQEMEMCWSLIESRRGDDFMARLLSIYITMRVDDITKLWCHSLSKDTIERVLADDAKEIYNDRFRRVRDKLGAHYQSADEEGKNDIFQSALLFRSFDYDDMRTLMEEMRSARVLIEGKELTKDYVDNLLKIQDLSAILKLMEELNADGMASLTNSALELMGPNRGGVIMCTPAQRKGQYLRGIELMVEYVRECTKIEFVDLLPARMFKRLLVCLIYNYLDNLCTREKLPDKAVQKEMGFDKMYMDLVSPGDDVSKLEDAFERHENIHHCFEYFSCHRVVRDKACGHFDEKSSMEEIDGMLDSWNVEELLCNYDRLLDLFNYICRNMVCLLPLTLPARSVLPNARFENPLTDKDFYKSEVVNELPVMMTPGEIMRSLRKIDKDYHRAKEQMKERLMSSRDEIFLPMMKAINDRLMEMTESKKIKGDFVEIMDGLESARRGDPERLQRAVLLMIYNSEIGDFIKLYLIRCLSVIARRDTDAVWDIWQDVRNWMGSENYALQAHACVVGLHYRLSESRMMNNAKAQQLEVNGDLETIINSVSDPVKMLGIRLLLCHRWYMDEEYGLVRKRESVYDDWLKAGLEDGLKCYADYIGMKESEDEWRAWENYRQTGHYLLLLYRLALVERGRGVKVNRFMELWVWNCFIRVRRDMYEAIGVGLLDELAGRVEVAEEIFRDIARDNPLNDDAQRILVDFLDRRGDRKDSK